MPKPTEGDYKALQSYINIDVNEDGDPEDAVDDLTGQEARDLLVAAIYLLRGTPTHKHLKRGSTYSHFGAAKVQTKAPIVDNDEVEVYRSTDDGSLWVRPPSEFFDGRFEKL